MRQKGCQDTRQTDPDFGGSRQGVGRRGAEGSVFFSFIPAPNFVLPFRFSSSGLTGVYDALYFVEFISFIAGEEALHCSMRRFIWIFWRVNYIFFFVSIIC